MRRSLIPLLVLLASIFAGRLFAGEAAVAADPAPAPAIAPADVVETVESDHWYVGTMNGAQSASLHSTTLRRPDGTRRTQEDMSVILLRSLGTQSLRIEMHQASEFTEDAAGIITGFRFDEVP